MRFEVRAPFFDAGYCHCTRCQGRTGTGSSVNGLVDARHVAVVQGADAIRTWQPEGGYPKSFCGECGAHLFSGVPGERRSLRRALRRARRRPRHRADVPPVDRSAPAWDPVPDDGLTRYPGGRPD